MAEKIARKIILTALILTVFSAGCVKPDDSQGSQANWSIIFGGAGMDSAASVQQTADSGFIVAGYSGTPDSETRDMLLLKTDSSGRVEWSKTYGGELTDSARYVLAGYSESYGSGDKDGLGFAPAPEKKE